MACWYNKRALGDRPRASAGCADPGDCFITRRNQRAGCQTTMSFDKAPTKSALFSSPCDNPGLLRTRRDSIPCYKHPVETTMDKVVTYVAQRAALCSGIDRVVLFGSRARGDATPRSDYDFAIYTDAIPHAEWSRWCLDTADSAPTLCNLDLVRASGPITDDLRRAIEAEGVTVYERRKGAQVG